MTTMNNTMTIEETATVDVRVTLRAARAELATARAEMARASDALSAARLRHSAACNAHEAAIDGARDAFNAWVDGGSFDEADVATRASVPA